MVRVKQFIADVRAATYSVLPEREEGQTNVEYALILVLIAIAAAAVLIIMGGKVQGVLSSVNTCLGGSC
jgi:Flp pilus assembly pilin Flp